MTFDCDLLLLNKPPGITSAKVAHQVKKILKLAKIGHTGTLDPIATGMLPLCLNQATRYSQYLICKKKHYTATGKFGIQTDTGDKTGQIIKTTATEFSEIDVLKALQSFIGMSEQVPPMYSAIHHEGKRLYELARQGKQVKRQSRSIQIDHIELKSYQPPNFTFDVICGSGTYIRVLIEDIAKSLNTTAHMTQLHRNWVDPLIDYPTVEFDDIHKSSLLEKAIVAIDTILPIPSIHIDNAQTTALRYGQELHYIHPYPESTDCKIYNKQEFLGIATCIPQQILKAKRLRPTTPQEK